MLGGEEGAGQKGRVGAGGRQGMHFARLFTCCTPLPCPPPLPSPPLLSAASEVAAPAAKKLGLAKPAAAAKPKVAAKPKAAQPAKQAAAAGGSEAAKPAAKGPKKVGRGLLVCFGGSLHGSQVSCRRNALRCCLRLSTHRCLPSLPPPCSPATRTSCSPRPTAPRSRVSGPAGEGEGLGWRGHAGALVDGQHPRQRPLPVPLPHACPPLPHPPPPLPCQPTTRSWTPRASASGWARCGRRSARRTRRTLRWGPGPRPVCGC